MITSSGIPLTTPVGVAAVLDSLLSTEPRPEERPALSYLRRKDGRGLVAVYGTPRDADHLYTVTVDEASLAASQNRQLSASAPPAWRGSWPGLVEDPSLGITVQAFPADRALPGLATAMAPAGSRPLWQALEAAGRQRLAADGAWKLVSAGAFPLRYKPGDRCVLRYRLGFQRSRGDSLEQASTSVIAKLYQQPAQAEQAGDLLRRLAEGTDGSWSPLPYSSAIDLPLLLSEDLGSPAENPPTHMGSEVIACNHPGAQDALGRAAEALADLHTSKVADAGTATRTGSAEAAKAAKRAGLLAAYLPELAGQIDGVSSNLCDRLAELEPGTYRPAHGSYKPSQLLVRQNSVFVVDFDQFCLADPALDVGYFLAYLRPAGLWYGRPGTRTWFEAAAVTFIATYTAQLTRRDVAESTAAGIAERARIYSAALLLKIATRRRNRLHSPRPAEAEAILGDIRSLLG